MVGWFVRQSLPAAAGNGTLTNLEVGDDGQVVAREARELEAAPRGVEKVKRTAVVNAVERPSREEGWVGSERPACR